MLTFENAQHPLADRRTEIAQWAHRAVVNVVVTPQVATRTCILTAAGFRPLDAAHLACDDQVLRRARRVQVGLRVQNPTEYVQEGTDG